MVEIILSCTMCFNPVHSYGLCTEPSVLRNLEPNTCACGLKHLVSGRCDLKSTYYTWFVDNNFILKCRQIRGVSKYGKILFYMYKG